jgi:hypothetical protein
MGAVARDIEGAASHDVHQLNAIQLVHDIGRRMAVSAACRVEPDRQFIQTLVSCDSCFLYVLEEYLLVLRASKTPIPMSSISWV